MSGISIKNGATYEFIMSQVYNDYDEIVCVCNGRELLLYNSIHEIPTSIRWGFKKHNPEIGTTEYHWRTLTDATMVFFSEEVNRELKSRKSAESVLKTIRLPQQNNDTVKLQTYFKMQ